MFGVTRTTKAQVSGVFPAVQLPNFLVSMLVLGVLISLGLMLAGSASTDSYYRSTCFLSRATDCSAEPSIRLRTNLS